MQLHRRLIAAAMLVILPMFESAADAEEATVPPRVQVALVTKLAAYDKNFAERSGERVQIMLVTKRGNADSQAVTGQLKAAFADVDRVGGLPHDETVIEYTDAVALASACRSGRVAILYLGPGLAEDVSSIGGALKGISVLSVAVIDAYVPKGAVLGFRTEGGKPKILLNLPQARSQYVAFAPEVVRIMTVIE
jgi:hypothetical protein